MDRRDLANATSDPGQIDFMPHSSAHPDLRAVARHAMLDRGFIVAFPPAAQEELRAETEMLVTDDGRVQESSVYPAVVQNKAQLTYNAVAAWLDQEPGSRTPPKIQQNANLQNQLKLQDEAAGHLRQTRHEAGALTFHTT